MSIKIISILFLLFSGNAAPAADYYMSTAGNDTNSGRSLAEPFRTFKKSLSVMVAGDTLNIRGGTYSEGIDSNNLKIPAGKSWSLPVTIKRYGSETVVLNAGGYGIFNLADNTIQYLIIDGLIFDGINMAKPDPTNGGGMTNISLWGGVNHVRVQNCELKNSPGQGITIFDGNGFSSDYNELINNKIHDNGTSDYDHGIYVNTNNNIIEGNEFYRNAGWGIHKYPKGDNNIIRNNRIHDNARVGNRGPGIGIYGGTGNLVYNNMIWGNKYGITIDYRESDAKVYNNTIVSNYYYCVLGGTGAVNPIIKNNICWNNTQSGIYSYVPATSSNNLFIDPGFVNLLGFDLHLKSGSAAIDKGASLIEVQKDADGVSRPQGYGYDIGAFELITTTAPVNPLAPKNLRVQ